jgi:formylglycine-generating enzyme required for sulfatase activity
LTGEAPPSPLLSSTRKTEEQAPSPPVSQPLQPKVDIPPASQQSADKKVRDVAGSAAPKQENRAPQAAGLRPPPVATSRESSPDKEPPALARSPYGPVEAGRARERWAEYYAVPPKITNSIALPLLLVPATEFMMGSDEPIAELIGKFPDAKQQWLKGEYPQHKIHITRPFYLGMYEVRVADFKQFCAATSYKTEAERDGKGGIGYEPAAASPFQQKPKYSWRNIGLPLKDDLPVVNVTWKDAASFCEWLTAKEGKRYRLPTEAEWECACRAGTTGRYCNGDSPDGVVKVCNLADADAHTLFPWWNHCVKTHDGFTTLAPVGKLAPNALGLFDMHGNVAEWCGDWFSDSYYQKSPFEDPPGPETGKLRVSRGGDWDRSALDCRSSSRDWPKPTDRTNYLGFRVVCDVDFATP